MYPCGSVYVPGSLWSKISHVIKYLYAYMWQCPCVPRGLKDSCEEILWDHEAVAERLVPMWPIENFQLPKSEIHMAVSTCQCPCGLKIKLSREKNAFL